VRGFDNDQFGLMPTCEIKEVAEWLIDGARSAPQPAQVLAQLSERLVACGIPLWRVAVFVRTLHPQVMGRRFIWRPGTEVEVSEAPLELLESADFLENPIAQVYATGRALRRKLADPDCAVDFSGSFRASRRRDNRLSRVAWSSPMAPFMR
jgi:adenylate cyclase